MAEEEAPQPQEEEAGQPGNFLSYDKYVDRFAKDVLALQRLWLIPLALCAFWLAIENSYETFKSIKREKISLSYSSYQVAHQKAKIVRRYGAQGGTSVNPQAALTIKASPENAVNLRQAQSRLEKLTKRSEDSKARIEKLKGDAVNLTVAGTVMPSRLSYAPTLWLAALLGWLIYFETIKLRAQKNLAAAVAAYGRRRTPFGLAEESSLWLAPIPRRIALRVTGEAKNIVVKRREMLDFLGWMDREEARNRVVGGLVWVGILLLVTRLVLVAAEVNSRFAVEQDLTGGTARILNTIGTAFFAAACLALLARLGAARSGRDQADPVPSRREALTFMAGIGTLSALIGHKARLQDLIAGKGKEGERIFGQPRFVAPHVRAKRIALYRIELRLARPGDVLVRARAKPGWLTKGRVSFHGVGGAGVARFYARLPEPPKHPTKRPTFHRIAPRAFRVLAGNIRKSGDPHWRDFAHSVTLEAAALALIGQGRMIDACDVLLGACTLAAPAPKPNLRLFDLLAGLAARYPEAADYRPALEAVIASGRAAVPQLPGAAPDPLAARPARWSSPRWVERWRGPATIHWGHPLDRVKSTRPGWFGLWGDRTSETAVKVALKPASAS
jgi:hypothetical protein